MRKAFAERPSFLNDANACAVSSVDSPSVIITTVGAYALDGIFALSSMSCFIALRVPPRGVRPYAVYSLHSTAERGDSAFSQVTSSRPPKLYSAS